MSVIFVLENLIVIVKQEEYRHDVDALRLTMRESHSDKEGVDPPDVFIHGRGRPLVPRRVVVIWNSWCLGDPVDREQAVREALSADLFQQSVVDGLVVECYTPADAVRCGIAESLADGGVRYLNDGQVRR